MSDSNNIRKILWTGPAPKPINRKSRAQKPKHSTGLSPTHNTEKDTLTIQPISSTDSKTSNNITTQDGDQANSMGDKPNQLTFDSNKLAELNKFKLSLKNPPGINTPKHEAQIKKVNQFSPSNSEEGSKGILHNPKANHKRPILATWSAIDSTDTINQPSKQRTPISNLNPTFDYSQTNSEILKIKSSYKDPNAKAEAIGSTFPKSIPPRRPSPELGKLYTDPAITRPNDVENKEQETQPPTNLDSSPSTSISSNLNRDHEVTTGYSLSLQHHFTTQKATEISTKISGPFLHDPTQPSTDTNITVASSTSNTHEPITQNQDKLNKNNDSHNTSTPNTVTQPQITATTKITPITFDVPVSSPPHTNPNQTKIAPIIFDNPIPKTSHIIHWQDSSTNASNTNDFLNKTPTSARSKAIYNTKAPINYITPTTSSKTIPHQPNAPPNTSYKIPPSQGKAKVSIPTTKVSPDPVTINRPKVPSQPPSNQDMIVTNTPNLKCPLLTSALESTHSSYNWINQPNIVKSHLESINTQDFNAFSNTSEKALIQALNFTQGALGTNDSLYPFIYLKSVEDVNLEILRSSPYTTSLQELENLTFDEASIAIDTFCDQQEDKIRNISLTHMKIVGNS